MNTPWQINDSTSKQVSNRFRQTTAALMMATFLSPAVWAAPAQSGRPQTLASPDAVPDGLSGPEWSSIRRQYEQHRHAAFPVAGGYQARNPGQQWQTRFDGWGFTTQPDGATWQWGLELTSYGLAGSERTVSAKPRVTTVSQRVTYDWDATLQEWFVNDQHGLEHGFTVRERPNQPGPNDREVLECASPLALWNLGEELGSALGFAAGVGRADEKRQGAGALQDAAAPSLNSQPSTLNFLLAVRGGLHPEVQADGRGVRFVDAQGTAALTYSELTVLDADGRKLPARFEPVTGGASVLASRDGLVETRLVSSLAPPKNPADITPCLRLVIDERGARYPLTIDPIAQQAYLKASNTGAQDNFGSSVAVSGDTVVIGAPGESSNATGVNGDQSDNSAVNSGAAYVFVRSGTNWSQQAYLKASNPDAGDGFGQSVAVSGDTVVVGAGGEASNATGVDGDQSDNSVDGAGAAYVFVRSGTTWSQQAYLKASNTQGPPPGTSLGARFGGSVAVSGDTVAVGAGYESSSATGVDGDGSDNGGFLSGAAYVFVRSGTTWSQQAYLKASNTELDDVFGASVAVSGDTVVVGANHESSNATGVNGNQTNNSGYRSGAAYVFVRSGTTWSQQAYLKASNSGADDYFGLSVAVSGDTVVVGTPFEDSNATGVNGNQSNNTARIPGAAYIFTGLGHGPSLGLAPDGSGGYFLRFTGAPDVTYRLQRAPSVTGPWSAIATNTAPASGLIEYHENAPPPGAAFYRTAQP